MFDFINDNGWGFEVEKRPLMLPDGTMLPTNMGMAVVRKDTDEPICVRPADVKLVDHKVVVDAFASAIPKGYDIVEMSGPGAVRDLAGRKAVGIYGEVSENGAVFRGSLVFGDFVEVPSTYCDLSGKSDINLARVDVYNSHNGSLAVQAQMSYLRLLCMNGMVRPHGAATAYGRHTKSLNIEAWKRKFENMGDMLMSDAETFAAMARTRITYDEAKSFLAKNVARYGKKADGSDKVSDRLLNTILEHWHFREEHTVWGLYNALTHWATHGEAREGSDRLTTVINRERRIAPAVAKLAKLAA